MKIKWLGHSCFLITSSKGTRIITDPFAVDKATTYKEVTLEADIVTSSHDHFDHNHVGPIRGNPVILKDGGERTVKDIDISTVHTWHDEHGGKERGPNLVFCFKVDGVKICHMGDTGERLQKPHLDAMGKVDVLLMPIGGVFTLDFGPAMEQCQAVNPAIVIPMHYKTEHCAWLKWTVDDFIKGQPNVKKLDTDEVEIVAGKLPKPIEIVVPKYKG
jgi:L-ascorbate metabolism protein UlaG (beta-lactamase superfamily)